MKLLLDENLPVRLKYRFSAQLQVSTVSDQGWSSVKDSKLLALMKSNGFNVLVTSDKGIGHQQNLSKYGVVIVLLLSKNNRYELLKASVSLIESVLPPNIEAGVIEIDLRKV